MKKLLLVGIAFLSFLSCEKNENESLTCKVTFAIEAATLKKSSVETMLRAKKIVLSIEDDNGMVVDDFKTIDLFKMNDSYISEPLALHPGNYALTTFFVIDENDSIIYLSPRENSTLSHLVEDPLPKSFSVMKHETSEISVEVIAALGSPLDFGYANFEIDYVKTIEFCIATFEYRVNPSSYTLTESDISILSNGKAIYSGSLSTLTNSIILPAKKEYEILLSKPGFEEFSINMDYDSILVYNCAKGGIPYTVVLKRTEFPIFETQPGPETGMDVLIWNLDPDSNRLVTSEFSSIAWTNQGRESIGRSLIKFDLSSLSPGTPIAKAELHLYGFDSPRNGFSKSLTAPNYTLLCRVKSHWEQSTVTWHNQPLIDISDAVFLDSCNTITNYKIDVTDHVRDMVKNPLQNHGWMLVLKEESYYQMMIFASSDNDNIALRPKLVVF